MAKRPPRQHSLFVPDEDGEHRLLRHLEAFLPFVEKRSREPHKLDHSPPHSPAQDISQRPPGPSSVDLLDGGQRSLLDAEKMNKDRDSSFDNVLPKAVTNDCIHIDVIREWLSACSHFHDSACHYTAPSNVSMGYRPLWLIDVIQECLVSKDTYSSTGFPRYAALSK
jgi:hypothetical protein